MNELLTTSAEITSVITSKDVQRAIKMLSKINKQPIITQLRSKYPIWKLIKYQQARNYLVCGGFPCYEDPTIPSNILRFMYSDGTFKDFDFTINPNFI